MRSVHHHGYVEKRIIVEPPRGPSLEPPGVFPPRSGNARHGPFASGAGSSSSTWRPRERRGRIGTLVDTALATIQSGAPPAALALGVARGRGGHLGLGAMLAGVTLLSALGVAVVSCDLGTLELPGDAG